MPQKTVLVTGAGFLGTYVAKNLLEKGYRVFVLDVMGPPEGNELGWLMGRQKSGAEFVRGDVSDLATALRVAAKCQAAGIIHTAALTDTELLANAPTLALRVNTTGTVNVLEAARLLGIKKVIMASSIAVYAPVQYQPVDEAHPVISPASGPALTSYSSSKVAAEAFGMHYWAEYGIGFMALRFSGIYGLGMRYPLYIKPVVESAVLGREINLGAVGDARRDLIYVEDAARAMVAALEAEESRLSSRLFNIGVGRMHSVFDIVGAVREAQPDSRISVSAGITREEAVIQKSRGVLSIQSARDQLGFDPSYSLGAGIKSYLDLYREYLGRAN